MRTEYHVDVSFTLTAYFLKIIGFWTSDSRMEKWFRNGTVLYTVVAIIFSLWVQERNLYAYRGDFSVCTYHLCSFLGLLVDLLKVCVLFLHKEKFFSLIVYIQKNFLHSNYNEYENAVITDVKQTCIYFVGVFSLLSHITLFCYIIRPLILNIGKNDTERSLIFNMWLDLPLSTSPYFEMMYTIQALSAYQIGICYLCFDNVFCIMCLQVAGQFRILQYRMSNMLNLMNKEKYGDDRSVNSSGQYYALLKNYIQHHMALIEFCATLEEIFTVCILGQVIIFGALISFIGYQVFLADVSPSLRLSFIAYLMTGMSQLWMFTYSCDCLTRESVNVAVAAYTGPWTHLPMDGHGKMIRKDLQMVIMRSGRPCYLTACSFSPISLETYTKVISAAMSYFTILKQRTVDEVTD